MIWTEALQGVVSDAAIDVVAERERQKAVEGWTPEHDDGHRSGQLALAAAAYMVAGAMSRPEDRDLLRRQNRYVDTVVSRLWPWSWAWWKPKARREDLVRGCALGLAEIERLDRLAKKG